MKLKRYSQEQKVYAPTQVEAGTQVVEVCRQLGGVSRRSINGNERRTNQLLPETMQQAAMPAMGPPSRPMKLYGTLTDLPLSLRPRPRMNGAAVLAQSSGF